MRVGLQTVVQLVGLDGRHGTREVILLRRTIADDHNLANRLGVFHEGDDGTVGSRELLWRHANVGNGDFRARSHINGVVSI